MAHYLRIASPFLLRTHVCAHRAYKTTLNLNLLIHTQSTRYNSTHSSSTYPPDHNYIKHTTKILKKTTNIKQSLLGHPPTNGELNTSTNTFIYPTPPPTQPFKYSPSPISVILAVPRPPVLKSLIETLSTLGVSSILLVRSSKSRRDYYGSHLLKNFTSNHNLNYTWSDNISGSVINGLVQSSIPYPPRIKILQINELQRYIKGHPTITSYGLKNDYSDHCKIITHVSDSKVTTSDVLRWENSEKAVFAIGPEAGWTDEEVLLFKEEGFKIATLGESILKVEQAAVVCVGVGLDHFNGGK
ncbi:hypothetical protein TrVE_jg11251 [Triparma verrucosa]|uniref:16S rRNA (uracil(1498)-N(3))-methyltransferase n=1 Tax=Triparma verrucosa TaxID=1606542 RepID=A0A9W7FLR1_9STRA|nr:hypothetical protein TrVE_jg11251 [Triparma verrucosa]